MNIENSKDINNELLRKMNSKLNSEVLFGGAQISPISSSAYFPNYYAPSLGIRINYWFNKNYRLGVEGDFNINDINEIWMYRYNMFIGMHLRYFKYVHPYLIGGIGRYSIEYRDTYYVYDFQPTDDGTPSQGHLEYQQIKENDIYTTIKWGLLFEFSKYNFAIETSIGSILRSEFNILYGLKLPDINQTPDYYSISLGNQYFYSIHSHFNQIFHVPYDHDLGNSEDFINAKNINIHVKDNNNIYEFTIGTIPLKYYNPENSCPDIWEICEPIEKFGIINLGYSKKITNNYFLSDYIDYYKGLQLFIPINRFDVFIPALVIGINNKYRYRNFAPLLKIQLLGTYSFVSENIFVGSLITLGFKYYY
jgi:hypothetical protein